jgi:hypothetical protein
MYTSWVDIYVDGHRSLIFLETSSNPQWQRWTQTLIVSQMCLIIRWNFTKLNQYFRVFLSRCSCTTSSYDVSAPVHCLLQQLFIKLKLIKRRHLNFWPYLIVNWIQLNFVRSKVNETTVGINTQRIMHLSFQAVDEAELTQSMSMKTILRRIKFSTLKGSDRCWPHKYYSQFHTNLYTARLYKVVEVGL